MTVEVNPYDCRLCGAELDQDEKKLGVCYRCQKVFMDPQPCQEVAP